MTESTLALGTRAIHAGAPDERAAGAVVTPIYQSSTYEYHGESYHDVGYIRLSTTPNHNVLGERIASLEGAEAGLVTGSGMAAISAVLLTTLAAGDHLLTQDVLYGGTNGLFDNALTPLGISRTVIDPQRPDTWADALRPKTKAFYVETLSNPLVQLADLEAVVAFAREHGLVTVIDNTFASPVNFRPAEHGFDLTIESCTKYMNGHNDIVAGSVVGSAGRVRAIKMTLDHLGGSLDPHACFLLERGLKTLPVRVRHQNDSAARIAARLEAHPEVATVQHPSLASHPQHERAGRLLDGFGGMMAFSLRGGVAAAEGLLAETRLVAHAPSLGGVDTLAVRPHAAVHSGLSEEQRAHAGIDPGLIRFSVGLEDPEDLIADLEQALAGR
ncbi:MAG: aminotransferase class I/II-fold pyridoxal phosphate-dependent enzyme [Gemmatimonadota bacterium]